MSAADYPRPMGVAVVAEHEASEQRVIDEHHARGQEVVIFTTSEHIGLIRDVARDLEANGDEPVIRWYRDARGAIQGVSLCAQLSPETVAAMKDAPFTKATVRGGR